MSIFQANKIKGIKLKKGKITITITIGIMFLIFTSVIFMQVKTISQTDISELELMRESELKSEITSLKAKYEETIEKIQETNGKILDYEEAVANGKKASQLLEKELIETEKILGKDSVSGEGIIIKMENGGTNKVKADDLLELVNLLKNAGAEAISINDERIVYDSYISDIINTNIITVKGTRISAPYTIKAIGNTSYLESAVSQKNSGYIDEKIAEGKRVTLERSTNVTILKHGKNLEFEYVKEGE